MKAASQTDHRGSRQCPTDEFSGVTDDGCRREPRHFGERDGGGARDPCRQPAKSRAEHDARHRVGRADAQANRVSRRRRGLCSKGRRAHATSARSALISASARSMSFRRSSYGRKALSKPFSATRDSSSKVKCRSRAACAYSSVSVTSLIRRLSVFSTTLSPRSKYSRNGCVAYDDVTRVCTLLVRQISSVMRRSLQ